MNLNQIAKKAGKSAGFRFKSQKSGKVFEVVSKTVSGKFLVKTVGGEMKEVLLKGDADRYISVSGSGSTNRVETLNAEILNKENELTGIEGEIEALQARADALADEITDLENDRDEAEVTGEENED
jgi:peptidoglycan hydrolase CwlO-like protein